FDGRSRRLAARGRVCGKIGDDLVEITSHDLRSIRAAAVEDDLQVRRSSRFDVARERGADPHRGDHPLAVDGFAKLFRPIGMDNAPEGRRAFDPVHEFPAPRSAIAIQYQYIDIPD